MKFKFMKRWYLWFEIVLIVCSNLLVTASLNHDTLSLINAFLDVHKTPFAIIFNCDEIGETVSTMKFFGNKGIRLNIHNIDHDVEISSLLKVDNYKLTVILDWNCMNSFEILEKAKEQKLLSRLHFWLILIDQRKGNKISDVDSLPTSDESLNDKLSMVVSNESSLSLEYADSANDRLGMLNIPLDSQVTFAQVHDKGAALQDVYTLMDELPLTYTAVREWSLGDTFPLGPRRDDYGGIIFQTATVVVGDVWENFLDLRYKHINSLTKFHYILVEHVSTMLNFRTNVTPVDSWGFPVNNTKQYDGVIGLLQRGEIQMASVGLLHKTARMDNLEYAGETVCYEGVFLFLKPSLSDVSNIYTLPFSRAVWITYFVVMVVFSYALYVTQRTETGFDGSQTQQPMSLSDSMFTAVGIVCQEGSPRDPQNLSSRIIFLSLLLLSLFLTTSYSAIIVSLLQTTSTAIRTLRDLMNSPFKLMMNDVDTNLKYVNETTDQDIRDIYFKHLFTQPYHQAFTTSEVGVDKMRKGLYAFHGDADAFRIMSETYEEYEKCRLQDIRLFSTVQLGFAVKRGTPYKEHIRQRARWLKESGISDREYKYWLTQKPVCHGNIEGFTSVRLQDFYPALLVFGYGFLLSILFLILENFVKKLINTKGQKFASGKQYEQ